VSTKSGQFHNFDAAILVAGGEDYVPLVEAVKDEDKRLIVWFLDDGLSPSLRMAADHYYDVATILFGMRGDLTCVHFEDSGAAQGQLRRTSHGQNRARAELCVGRT
jgi:NYN domain-containing protein